MTTIHRMTTVKMLGKLSPRGWTECGLDVYERPYKGEWEERKTPLKTTTDIGKVTCLKCLQASMK